MSATIKFYCLIKVHLKQFLGVNTNVRVSFYVFRRLCCHTASSIKIINDVTIDRFGSITFNAKCLAHVSVKNFPMMLKDSLAKWKSDGRKGVWMKIPIEQSQYIPAAANEGFRFHHADGDYAMMYKWLPDTPSKLPHFATHQIGVAGCVINEEKEEILAVKDKHRPDILKVPGGLSDLGEDFGDTACREVYEETGIKSEFKSILSIRQHHNHPNAFGRSDIYAVCRLSPLSYDISPCEEEIVFCEWLKIRDFICHSETSPFGKRIGMLALHGLRRGFDQVDLSMHEIFFQKLDMKFKVYHRPLSVN